MNIDKLEELARAATPGEWVGQDENGKFNTDQNWTASNEETGHGMSAPIMAGDKTVALVCNDLSGETIDDAISQLKANAAFIAETNPSVILGLIAQSKSRKNMFDMIVNSVCAALERAGVKEVDDPGEAIDVLVADKDKEIARLREALQRILNKDIPINIVDVMSDMERDMVEIARAALAKGGEDA